MRRRQVSITETPSEEASEEGGSKRARRSSARIARERIAQQASTPHQDEGRSHLDATRLGEEGSIVDVSITDGEEEHVSQEENWEDVSNEMDTEEEVDDVKYRTYYKSHFVYRKATEKESTCSCVQCNQSIQKNEDVLAMRNPDTICTRQIYGHACPLEGPKLVHLQCTDQPVTHYKGFVSCCHKNFLDCCVVVQTRKGYLPLSHFPEKYEKLEKILKKHFYLSSDAVRNVPKALFDKNYQIISVNEDTSDLSEHSDDMSDIADIEEKWILQKILNSDEILDPNSRVCDTEDCNLFACTKYVLSTDMNNTWYGCIDCQKEEFGGWPQDLDEYPVEFLLLEDLDTMKDLCTETNTIEAPTVLPIVTSAGELVNASNNEVDSSDISTNMSVSESSNEGFGVPEPDRSARPKEIIELSLPDRNTATFQLQNFEKRNAPDDNIFFCSHRGNEKCCKGILIPFNPDDVSDASKDVYRVKCNVTKCLTHPRGPVRFVCKICNSQFRGFANREIKCQHKKLEICPYMTTLYTIDMNGLPIDSTFEKLLSNPSSPMFSLFQTHTVFELGANTNKSEPCNRMRQKMGIVKAKQETGLFHRRVEHFQRMEAVCIWFKNVLSQDGEDTSKICEKSFFDKMIHYHHGRILSVPEAMGRTVHTKKDAFGLEEYGLYAIAAEPNSDYLFKQDLRKGRTGTEKEMALYEKMIEAEKAEVLNDVKKLLPEHMRAVEEQGEVIALQTEKLEENSMVVEEQGEAIAFQTAKLEEMETKIEQLETKVDKQHNLLKQIAISLGAVRIGDNDG